jgi:HAMP domain-containing protein
MNGKDKVFLKPPNLQLLLQILTVLGLVLATYITVRLAPISQNLAVLTEKVDAFNATHTSDPSRDEFNSLKSDIGDIKENVRDLHSLFIGQK